MGHELKQKLFIEQKLFLFSALCGLCHLFASYLISRVFLWSVVSLLSMQWGGDGESYFLVENFSLLLSPLHSSYLLPIPPRWYLSVGKKTEIFIFLYVEKCLHVWHVWHVDASKICNLCCFVLKSALLRFILFCFAAIYALLCGKNWTKKMWIKRQIWGVPSLSSICLSAISREWSRLLVNNHLPSFSSNSMIAFQQLFQIAHTRNIRLPLDVVNCPSRWSLLLFIGYLCRPSISHNPDNREI